MGHCDSKIANAICGEVLPGYELSAAQCKTHMVRGRKIVIKAMEKMTIRRLKRIGHKENPLHELSIMQMMGSDAPHVSGLIDAVEDVTTVYSIMLDLGTELFNFAGKMSENKIRHCFLQIVKGVQTMQRFSLCHRDISLENILVSESGICTIIDFGLTLVVPRMQQFQVNSVLSSQWPGGDNGGGEEVTDDEDSSADLSALAEQMDDDEADSDNNSGANQNNFEREYIPVMLLPQGNCGKENYVAPEIMANKNPFDAMVVDNWALGVLLFMLFTGRPPFIRACTSDQYYRSVQKHSLKDIMMSWDMAANVSPEAIDLLERMLKSSNPRNRLTCEDILSHRWMTQTVE